MIGFESKGRSSMGRPSRIKRENEMLREMLQASSPEKNPELMLALPDGSVISQAEESALTSAFSLLIELGSTSGIRRQQVHMDATSLLRAVWSQIKEVPSHLAEKSQQYGLSTNGVEFSRATLAYGRFCLTNNQEGLRFHPVKTSIAPEEFQAKAPAATR
jgi:hypothetical protein